jgi:hypothetical protein
MNTTKKYLLAAVITVICSFAAASSSRAQTALFIYNDNNGTPNAGTYTAGSSFSFSISLAFTPGGSISNLNGLSYWFQQTTPAGSPFNFAITLRDVTGSPFTDLQTGSLTYPQTLSPSNAKDLGALLPSGNSPLGAGTYLVATLTISIDSGAAPGNYTISNVFSGGKTSVITDSAGHTFAIPEADYFITVVAVPEPATWTAGGLVVAALLFTQRRRIAKTWRAA